MSYNPRIDISGDDSPQKYGVGMAMQITNDDDDIEDEFDPQSYDYSLVISSRKCKFSEKLMRKINQFIQYNKNPKFTYALQSKSFIIFDIVDLYRKGQNIPTCVSDVPILLIVDNLTKDVEETLRGKYAFEWFDRNIFKSDPIISPPPKPASISGQRLTFDPNRINISEIKDESDATKMFQEPKDNSTKADDYAAMIAEYENTTKLFTPAFPGSGNIGGGEDNRSKKIDDTTVKIAAANSSGSTGKSRLAPAK